MPSPKVAVHSAVPLHPACWQRPWTQVKWLASKSPEAPGFVQSAGAEQVGTQTGIGEPGLASQTVFSP
jgi:hypothetical protein